MPGYVPPSAWEYIMANEIRKEQEARAAIAAQYPPPRFQHDCKACTYLGQYNEYDLYCCPQGGIPTVIARFGDDGPEYQSGLIPASVLPELNEARKRAIEHGLLSEGS